MDVREKLVELLSNIYFLMIDGPDTIGEYTIPHKFKEKIADHLISNGVTVQEWISVKEPPKEKGTYIVCTDNGGILLGHWYGTAWNAGGGANKHLAYCMEKPQPPKGE